MYELVIKRDVNLPGKFYGNHRVDGMEYKLFNKEITLIISYSPIGEQSKHKRETEICHIGRLSNNSSREIKKSDWLVPDPEDEKRLKIVSCRLLNDQVTKKVVLFVEGIVYETEFLDTDIIYPGGYIRQNSKWSQITLKFVPDSIDSSKNSEEPLKPLKFEKSACGICFVTRPDRVLTICDVHVHSTTCRDCFVKTQTCAICGIVRESAEGIIAKSGSESLVGLTAKGDPAITFLY